MMIKGILTIAIAAQAAAVPTAPSDIWQPASKWQVDYNENMCLLTRAYARGTERITLGFRPTPLGTQNELVLASSAGDRGDVNVLKLGNGQLRIGTTGPSVSGRYQTWRPRATPAMRMTLFELFKAPMGEVAAADVLTLTTREVPSLRVAVRVTPAALAALQTCQDDLLKTWGFDRSSQPETVKPVAYRGNILAFFASDAYPAEAVSKNQQGAVTAIFVVGTDGHASQCRAVVSSGYPLLDQTTCDIIAKRVRADPAIGKDGKPASTLSTMRVRWVLPL